MSHPLRSFALFGAGHFSQKTTALLTGLLASLALCFPSEAAACGGGTFYTEVAASEDIATTGHRVVISMSKTQTVLWDQITFQGAPDDFAWVYPVKAGAKLEVATDSWLEALDMATAKTVYSPQGTCHHSSGYSGGSGCACGDGAGAGDSFQDIWGEPESPVAVLDSDTVGPYDVQTITSDVPGAIGEWLTTNGYNVPATASPVLDAYAAEGYDFFALRLTPGASVSMMKPVRVITPGPTSTFPMRMLALGAAEKVALQIFVLTEGSVRVASHANAYIDPKYVRWDWDTGKSDYSALRDDALSTNGGAVFLTSYSAQSELFADTTISYREEPFTKRSIALQYLSTALKNDETQSCAQSAIVALVAPGSPGESATVVDLCDDQGNCTEPGSGELDSRDLACGAADDLAQALIGMHPKDVWLTRLEANLPKSALDKDLVLEPVSGAEPVLADIAAFLTKGDVCAAEEGAMPPEQRSSSQHSGMVALFLAAITLAAAATRKLVAERRVPAG